MKVTYIYHSGFSIELDRCVLIFDYYKGKLPRFPADKEIYVFVSHRHPDHFKAKIFELLLEYPKVHYFLSDDIRLEKAWLSRLRITDKSLKDLVTVIHPLKKITYEGLTIESLTSNDEGVAFVITVEGKQIYFAGDLNWWHWIGEPDEENKDMGERYCSQIDKIAGRHFDAAFVPLDPRLEETAYWGMNYFLKQCSADALFPMHMWDQYDLVKSYKETDIGKAHSKELKELTAPGDTFLL